MKQLDLLISSQEDLEKRGVLTEIGISYLNGLRQARKIILENGFPRKKKKKD